jgi:hypothetical protein
LERVFGTLAGMVRFGALLAYVLGMARAMGQLRDGGLFDLALVVVALGFAGGFASRAGVAESSPFETSGGGVGWWCRAALEVGLVAAGALVCIPLSAVALVIALGSGLAEPLALAWCCPWLWSSAYSLAWD